jgi:hypothetical protein
MAEFKCLYGRVPIYTSEGEEVLRAREVHFRKWSSKNKWRIRRKYSLLEVDFEPLMPGQDLWLSNDVEIIIPEGADTVVYKGLAVRLEMFAILDLIDSENIGLRDQSYFVLMDGSGAIDFSGIELVLDKLITEQYPIVLGKRPTDDSTWFMGEIGDKNGEDRKKIELFENHLLEKYVLDKNIEYGIKVMKEFNGELPDAQAGCWGVNIGALKNLSLTAQRYGLEFDVTASALEARQPIVYTEDLKRGSRKGESGFKGFDDSIKKMEFILHKLSYSKGELNGLLDNYKKLPNYRDKELPQDYERSLMKFINSRGFSQPHNSC